MDYLYFDTHCIVCPGRFFSFFINQIVYVFMFKETTLRLSILNGYICYQVLNEIKEVQEES